MNTLKRFLRAMAKPFLWLPNRFDFGDLVFFAGLGGLAYGIYLIDIPRAFIVTGIVLMATAYAKDATGILCTIIHAIRGVRVDKK